MTNEDYSDLSGPPNAEGFLRNALNSVPKLVQRYSPFESSVSASVDGPMMAAGGANRAEDVAPMATQGISNVMTAPLRLIPGAAPAINTAATTLSEVGRQGVKSLRGEGFDAGQVGNTAAITGATELAGAGLGKLFMGKAGARHGVKTAAKKLGSMKESISKAGTDPMLGANKLEMIEFLKSQLGRSASPAGRAAGVMKRWIKDLGKIEGDVIGPEILMQLEDQLGQAASYMSPNGFMQNLLFKQNNPVKDKALEQGVKASRSNVSQFVDDIAEKIGLKEWKSVNKDFSRNKTILGDDKTNALTGAIQGMTRMGSIPGLGYAASQLGLPGGVGVGVGAANALRKIPGIQDLIYQALSRTGAGTAAKVGVSDFFRNATSR